MSSSAYQQLPTSSTYPPPNSTGHASGSSRSANPFHFFRRQSTNNRLPGPASTPIYIPKSGLHRLSIPTALRVLIGSSAALLVIHYVIIGAFPSTRYSTKFRQTSWSHLTDGGYTSFEEIVNDVSDRLDPSAGQPGTFFRDSYPLRSMVAFHELAEKEIEARGLDTCGDQIGRKFIEAYSNTQMPYCLPPQENSPRFNPVHNPNSSHLHYSIPGPEAPPTRIWCTPIRHDEFTKWWPYPASPCLATNLRTIPDDQRSFRAAGCSVTGEGKDLIVEMGRESFLGTDIRRVEIGSAEAECKETVERTVLVVGRQDQWNPFHVAEDLITTVVTALIAAKAAPDLIATRLQVVFSEGFGMDANHFTALWDRVGAWAPRRLSLDPWTEGLCLTNSIHSIGAGASLLSAMGVGHSFTCASSITWAASHYYRHLFGLMPQSLSFPDNLMASHHQSSKPRKPINVLWLSRAKLDAYAQKENDWSIWRDIRHINNEPELIDRLRSGLSSLCENEGISGENCIFEDAQDVPETWGSTSSSSVNNNDPLPLRFATLDPTVHALETQIHFVGHSTILVSSHGGALGLSLFLPPGDAVILELQVPGVRGNYHFQHMAYEMGHGYEVVAIERDVDVDEVWEVVKDWVEKVAVSG